MDPPPPPPPSSSSLPVCKFFLAGSCTKHDCKFLHDASTTSPFSNVCPFYKKGRENSCSYGDKCRYDHHAPTPAAAAVGSSSVPAVVGGPASSSATTTNTGSVGGAILSFATTMNTKAPSFIPTGGAGAGLYLSQQLQRTSLGAQAGGTGGVNAGSAWQSSSQSLEHLRRGGTTTTTTTGMDEAEEYGGDGADDWGYEDEYGNWVSFNTGEGEDMADFVAAQLPDDDDLFLGMTASSGDLQEYQREDPQQQQQQQQQQQHVAGGDGYGYFDQQGQWVNIEDPQSQAFLEQQYQLQQQQLQLQQQQQQQHYHFQQHQQRQIPRDVNAMFRPPEEVNLSDHSYDQQRAFDMQIECSICLERVADESRPFSARRFGLLDKCDHSFCLSCIRGWRDGGVQGKEAGANATEQARMCPICRVNSFFITPSAHFPRTPEEKEEILKNYLSKMKQIPCKHYNNGRCPFGTSCFYSHGSGENDVAVRKTTTAGEELHILTTPTLADYLDVSKKVGGGGR